VIAGARISKRVDGGIRISNGYSYLHLNLIPPPPVIRALVIALIVYARHNYEAAFLEAQYTPRYASVHVYNILCNDICKRQRSIIVSTFFRSGCIEKEPSSNCVRLTDLTCSS